MLLAGQPQRLFTIDEVSEKLRVSAHHLTKVVQALSKGGYIETFRGKGGGFRLADGVEDIPVGKVVRWLEPDRAVVECFRADGGACTLTASCRFKHNLYAAEKAFLNELDKTTIGECAIPLGPYGLNHTNRSK